MAAQGPSLDRGAEVRPPGSLGGTMSDRKCNGYRCQSLFQSRSGAPAFPGLIAYFDVFREGAQGRHV